MVMTHFYTFFVQDRIQMDEVIGTLRSFGDIEASGTSPSLKLSKLDTSVLHMTEKSLTLEAPSKKASENVIY